MPSEQVINCSRILKEKGLTIAFAESVTAGRLASEFSLTADSGSVLKGGLVCYDAEVKQQVLGIAPDFLRKYTPESAEVTRELAVRLKSLIESDIQVGITGLTKPGGSETEQKPVGSIFVHLCIGENAVAVREVFEGTPEQIILEAIELVATVIIRELNR